MLACLKDIPSLHLGLCKTASSDETCAGVVVIDDQPEVSIDDPSFLFESNEGFQEVTSRRAQKSKQKAALEEALKKSQEQQAQAAAQAKRMDKEAKVLC